MATIDESMIRFLIGRARVKYQVLDNIFRGLYIPNGKIVLHVDLSAILYRLYRTRDLDMIYHTDSDIVVRDLVVCILNVIGHYRRYFMTRMGLVNDIILYWNWNEPAYQKMLNENYRKNWFDKLDIKHGEFGPLNAMVHDAIDFIQGLVPYFEGIYCCMVEGVDAYTSMTEKITCDQYKDFHHMIFSRNMLTTQLIGENVTQFYNKRDDSYLITAGNVYQNGILRGKKTRATENLNASYLPLIWMLGGCSDINLEKSKYINGVTGAVKEINRMVDEHLITPDISAQEFLRLFSKRSKEYGVELRTIPVDMMNRYRLVNLPATVKALTKDQQINLWKNHLDLYDQSGLEEINDRLALIGENIELLEVTNLNMSGPDQLRMVQTNEPGSECYDYTAFSDFFQ